MNKTLISAFHDKTRELGVLSSIRTDGSYGDFVTSVFGAFDRVSPKQQNHLLEAFLLPLTRTNASAANDGALTALARSFFASCPPSFAKQLETYLAGLPPDSKLGNAAKLQLSSYRAELLEKERRKSEAEEADRLRREEQEKTRRREEEERRRARAEQEKERRKLEEEQERQRRAEQEEQERQRRAEHERQQAEKAAKERAARALQTALQWGAVLMAALPVLVAGFSSAQLWWAQSNYAAIVFYALFLAAGVKLFRRIAGLEEYEWSLRRVWSAWLTAGVMALTTYLTWSSVPNIVKAILQIGTLALPFTPYARGALGSLGAGVVAAIAFHFAARFCSFVAMAFLGWVLPDGAIPKVSEAPPPTIRKAIPVDSVTSLFAPSSSQSPQGIVASYQARIGPRDLRNSRGVYLPDVPGIKARDILLQERFNFHDGISRDPEDADEGIFQAGNRTRLRNVFESRQVRFTGYGDPISYFRQNPVVDVLVTDSEIIVSPGN